MDFCGPLSVYCAIVSQKVSILNDVANGVLLSLLLSTTMQMQLDDVLYSPFVNYRIVVCELDVDCN